MKRLLMILLLVSVTACKQDTHADIAKLRAQAAQGDAYAQNILGDSYAKGTGVEQDLAEAAKWYRLSAVQGDADAQNNLGYAYFSGDGVAQDYVRAYMWANLSAARGNTLAVTWRSRVAAKMTPQQIAEAQQRARECEARKYKNCE